MEKECKEKDIRINKNGNWVDLTELPRKNGKCNKIDWANSVGYFVKFKYEDIEGEIEIVDYNKNNRNLDIKYNNKIIQVKNDELIYCKLNAIKTINKYQCKKYLTPNKWIDLSNLYVKGKGIDWGKSINMFIKFGYLDTIGEIKILNYIELEQKLLVQYLDFKPSYILTNSILGCNLACLLGKITTDFKIEIGQILKDDKRDITIIDRKYIKNKNGNNLKYYKYKCNKCGFECGEHYRQGEYQKEMWISENNLIYGSGCSVCCPNPQIVVPEINSIVANEETHWMIPYFQGGYEEAKKYTKRSSQKINFTCPNCNNIKYDKIISNLYKNHSIGCTCGDGFSYPEKFMYSILEQLNVEFETQYSPKWADGRRYDFYFELNNEEYIVEMDGGWHYKDNTISGETKEYIKHIDDYKDILANQHNIKIIRICCDYGNDIRFNFIKNNILNSELNNIFDLYKVNWNKCEEFAINNLCKEICEYWNDKEEWETTTDLVRIFKINSNTIRKYLKIGNRINWTKYNTKEELRKRKEKAKINCKKIVMLEGSNIINYFDSAKCIEDNSEELFGKKLYASGIRSVCKGTIKKYKGFTFKYVNEDYLDKIS